MVTRAKTDIRAGEELTFLYAAKMEGRREKRTAFERILENIAPAGCLDAPFLGEAGTLTVAVQGNPHEVVAVRGRFSLTHLSEFLNFTFKSL